MSSSDLPPESTPTLVSRLSSMGEKLQKLIQLSEELASSWNSLADMVQVDQQLLESLEARDVWTSLSSPYRGSRA